MSKAATGGLIASLARRLRYPQLFFVTALLFCFDLIFPDAIPLIDEVLLGLLTVLLGSLRNRREEVPRDEPRVKNVTPPGR